MKEVLCIDNDDQIISILRHFKWNQTKVEEKWFENMEKLEYQIGIKYDKSLVNEHKDIDISHEKNNNGTCYVCFDVFDKSRKPFSLLCGHQFCRGCFSYYLKDKVKETGARCVFTRCPQPNCNVTVPHSAFLELIEPGVDPQFKDDLREKYLKWHCKQMTEDNRNIRWCPEKGCDNVIERSDYATRNTVECQCGKNFCF